MYTQHIRIHLYHTTPKISSANIAFGSATIEWYYTGQQLIAQLSSARGETTVKRGRMLENSFFPWFICCIINAHAHANTHLNKQMTKYVHSCTHTDTQTDTITPTTRSVVSAMEPTSLKGLLGSRAGPSQRSQGSAALFKWGLMVLWPPSIC